MDLYFFKILLQLAKASPWHLRTKMRALRCDRLFVVRKPSRRKKKAQKNPNKIVLIFVSPFKKKFPFYHSLLNKYYQPNNLFKRACRVQIGTMIKIKTEQNVIICTNSL